ncbi:MAG: hypothetical protein RJB13_1072 [Pseudomonadota bacterium]
MTFINRRDLLTIFGLGLGSSLASRIFMRDVSADQADQHFFLYVHCGSWDGIATGLLQPNSVNSWPAGCFFSGQSHQPGARSTRYRSGGEAVGNPLVGQITASNGHLLTHYAKPLGEVSGQLLHVTCAPGSLDHNVARLIQQTGSPSGQPHWISGLAQVLKDPGRPSQFVVNSPLITGTTPDISNIAARNLERFRGLFKEVVAMQSDPLIEGRTAFAKAAASSFDSFDGPSILPANYKTTFEGTIGSIIHGIDGVSEDDAAVISAEREFSPANLRSEILRHFSSNDAQGIIDAQGSAALSQQLILAGALAASSAAYGMVIQMPGEDRHFGGSDINTARMAGNLWTQLTQFWKWLESAKIQERVTIIVSHEFSRTAWNGKVTRGSVERNGNTIEIASPGRDHHTINGLYVLNSKLKQGMRYGGLRNGFTGAGSRSLNSPPDAAVSAPTTQQALGTIFHTLFDQFKHPGQADSGRRVREIWPTFKDDDLLPALRGII